MRHGRKTLALAVAVAAAIGAGCGNMEWEEIMPSIDARFVGQPVDVLYDRLGLPHESGVQEGLRYDLWKKRADPWTPGPCAFQVFTHGDGSIADYRLIGAATPCEEFMSEILQ